MIIRTAKGGCKEHQFTRLGNFKRLLGSHRIVTDNYFFSHGNISIFGSDVLFHIYFCNFSNESVYNGKSTSVF